MSKKSAFFYKKNLAVVFFKLEKINFDFFLTIHKKDYSNFFKFNKLYFLKNNLMIISYLLYQISNKELSQNIINPIFVEKYKSKFINYIIKSSRKISYNYENIIRFKKDLFYLRNIYKLNSH